MNCHTQGTDVNRGTGNAGDTLESDMKGRVSDAIIRANGAIRNVFFITRWR